MDYLLSPEYFDLSSKINLLQGEFSLTGASGSFSRYMPLVAAACLAIVLQCALNFLGGYYFHHRADRIGNKAKALYVEIFPDEKSADNLAGRLEGKLRNSSLGDTSSQFPRVFTITAEAILKTGNRHDIQLKQFRYDRPARELKLDLEATSIAMLDALKKQISDNGFQVEIVSANSDNTVIKATLLVKTG